MPPSIRSVFADGRMRLDHRSLTVGHDRRGHAGRRRRSHRGGGDGEPEPAHEDALLRRTRTRPSSPRSASTRSSGRSASRASSTRSRRARSSTRRRRAARCSAASSGASSMALHEETFTDHNLGRFMNHNIAEYHIPVNADVHDIEVDLRRGARRQGRARSASRASARSASSARRRRSPTPSSTPPASASATCRSPSTRC